jgi:hypothetical protein
VNEALRNLVTEYATAIEQKAKCEQDIEKTGQQLRLADLAIKRFGDEAKKQASANPTYIDIGANRLVIVSNSILEICPLNQLENR